MRALIARRLSIVGFVLAGLLLVIVAAVAYQRIEELKSASRWVEHSLSVETAGGLVTVRVLEEEAAVLEVRDTGAGFPPELGERIFELFV
jgi:signal transduction histidine kinase